MGGADQREIDGRRRPVLVLVLVESGRKVGLSLDCFCLAVLVMPCPGSSGGDVYAARANAKSR